MGMGDPKKPFEPNMGNTVKCDVTGRLHNKISVLSCPHPSVIERYGFNGSANVGFDVCMKCKYGIKPKMIGGVMCGYKEQK